MNLTSEFRWTSQTEMISGTNTQWREAGNGPPLLYLHPGDGFDPLPALDYLARTHRVIAPSHPGFDDSELPGEFRTVDDLAYFYLDLIDQFALHNVLIMGISLGGWIAAEIAIKSTSRLRGLILVDALGARFSSDPRNREILDLFSISQWELPSVTYHTEALRGKSFKDLPQERLRQLAHNYETFCLYGWSPTLHDPRLARRLRRIDVPTAVIWGREDRVVNLEYGQHWANSIKGASFTAIDGAGHYPHEEQPTLFSEAVDAFIDLLPADTGQS